MTESMSDTSAVTSSPYFAAVDLGSNSFHMIIARVQDGHADIVDREKEMVQIARGIGPDGRLAPDSQERALACLARFAERLRDIPRGQIRAVGTKTLRSAHNSREFLQAAERTLGVSIQIISGYEEARLIYIGLSHSAVSDHGRRLVVDIGGGSTEFVIGRDREPLLMESLSLGCVTWTQRFFARNGGPTRRAMKKALLAACAEIEGLRGSFLKAGWEVAYGTSGTVRAIAGLTAARDGGAIINRDSLAWLARQLVDNRSSLEELPALRRSVLPAGVVILQAVFEQLGLASLHVGDAALKEGLLFDTIGRLEDHDVRQESVRKLQLQYKVDLDHAARVCGTALDLWRQIDGPPLPGVSRTKVLAWAAQLHEIGMSISHAGYHHHGYYILRHSDLAGFGRYEQYILANLVRAHRKGLSRDGFENMDDSALAALTPLLLCLRLAVLLHRRREEPGILPRLSVSGGHYRLDIPRPWLADHPLTEAGLDREKKVWQKLGVVLDR